MKYYEVWQGANGAWLIYEVTNDGQHYCLIKSFKTEKGARNWTKKIWHRVIWR